jgi:hypothetical protein
MRGSNVRGGVPLFGIRIRRPGRTGLSMGLGFRGEGGEEGDRGDLLMAEERCLRVGCGILWIQKEMISGDVPRMM